MRNTYDILKGTLLLLGRLKTAPSMFVADTSFNGISCFLIGYVTGLEQGYDTMLHADFSKWFNKKVKRQNSLFWSAHIAEHYKDLPEDERILKLIELTGDFFIEHEAAKAE